MGKRKAALNKCFLGISVLVVSWSSFAKTPIDKTLDFLVGPKLGSWRSFKCREAVDGKVTDEHAYYDFHDDGYYSRLNSHPDPRTGHRNSVEVKGKFRVKIDDGMLKIQFVDEFIGSGFQNNQKPYDGMLIGTDGNDTMALMMDRPVPGRPDIRDHLRLVCVGEKPSGGGPQRSY
ncbi:hypothetical protein [Burkholderia sp. Ac-20344]|uniref:hypothetical protein n=1 Tax=Burkholderia sp. Ac-20344 TaxID=2703890 RepID=UPI00197B9EFC|nr:hypothetical protein [Burkholderia sp. Ac-20344]MBN3831697.1 hypothetical protein [Burkholderia sp. Ac-20344]